MKDITPLIASGKKILESYGGGCFTVAGEKYNHNIIIMPDAVFTFTAENIENAEQPDIQPLLDNANKIEVLLVGGGDGSVFFKTEIEHALAGSNIAVEYMSTGAAARTYNVLLSEERKVAVVLIAV